MSGCNELVRPPMAVAASNVYIASGALPQRFTIVSPGPSPRRANARAYWHTCA